MDSATLAGKLQAYDATPVTATDALNSAMAQYGIPEIRNTVSGLRTTLANTTSAYNNVDPSVTGRTQGSLVTEAQRHKQVTNEQAPIADQLKTQTGALGDATTNLSDAMGQATTAASNKVNDYNSGRAALQAEYDMANKREQDAAATALEQQKMAEQVREANMSAASKAASSTDSAAGYKVGKYSSGNYHFVGPNGDTNMYQYAAAMNGGDAGGTYTTLKQLLANGSATDKGAAAGMAKLEKQGLSQSQIIARLKASNGYIFN